MERKKLIPTNTPNPYKKDTKEQPIMKNPIGNFQRKKATSKGKKPLAKN